MQLEEGVVLEIVAEGKRARVRVGRHEECTGCGACAAICPAKEKALTMVPVDGEVFESSQKKYDFHK